MTVGFLSNVAGELDSIAARSGMTKTDIINRAVTLYAYVDARIAAGDDLLIRSSATGDVERIKLI